MLTLKELVNDVSSIDKKSLVEISNKLWTIGSLEQIKENVDLELFYLHISINIIGNWKADGWWNILCEQADLVPYIPATLDKLHLLELKKAFENVINLFPEYTVFKSDDTVYYDIVNFLQNTRFKVHDERLKNISPEKRKELVMQCRKNLDILEELTQPIWGECAKCNGWKPIIDWIIK